MHRNIKKLLHMCIIIVIIVAIGFVALMLILNYDENGETNMPFDISKISIISSTDAQDVENTENKWEKIVTLNNDIYIYIEKNENYKKTETIENITLSNFKAVSSPKQGELAIYKPSVNEVSVFQNNDENKATEINFEGDLSTDIQKLKISNQGGNLAFRCSINNIGTYISNDNYDIIDYDKLLSKIGVQQEDINTEISFEIQIKLNSGKSFLTKATVNIPVEGIIESGRKGIDITDLNDIVFKRIEN